mgnify:CR=1 FL=1
MKFKLIIIFFFVISCAQNYTKSPYTSKGFALIYNEEDFINKVIKNKLDNTSYEIAHNKLRAGTLIKLINPSTNKSMILKNTKKVEYPEFYKILITNPVAKNLELKADLPFLEIIELKRNKSFIAEKTQIYNEEKKIHSNAPVEKVKIDNISKNKKNINKSIKNNIYIIIAEFYSIESANLLKKRIDKELTNFDSKKIIIKNKKTNKISLLSGPYNSINLMKNDYIQLKKFGFEELDLSINE